MRNTAWMLAGALALPAGAALAADDGAVPSPGTWARWQGRVSLGVASSPWRGGADTALGARPGGAALMGDYYFSPSFDGPRLLGGFRATSGLVLGARSWLGGGTANLAGAANGAPLAGRPFAIGQAAPPGSGEPYAEPATQPYVGIGYSGLSAHNGFSFSADLGLLARGTAAGSGRALASQNLDDAVRQMRMTPLVQFGASYSF